MEIGFYDGDYPNNGSQSEASALAYYTGAIRIGSALDEPFPFTLRDKGKLDRYDENPLANGAAFARQLVLLQQYQKVATDDTDFTADNIMRGQFQARTETSGGRTRDILKLALLPEDEGSVAYWMASPQAPVLIESHDGAGDDLLETPDSVHRTDPVGKPWLLRITFPENSGAVDLGNDRYNIRGNPKFAPGDNSDLSDVEDFAKVGNPAKIPSDKTLEPLTGADTIPFNFGASTADPTAAGSRASVTDRDLRFGTVTSDTAVQVGTNVITGGNLTLTQGEVTHAGASVLVDLDVANIATDRFTDVELLLQTATGTLVSAVEFPHDPTFSRRGLQFPLAGLTVGGGFRFALKATVRGRQQIVTATLSNLRYRSSDDPPLQPFVERIAQAEVDKQADLDGPRFNKVEDDILKAGGQMPAPLTKTPLAAPKWDAAGRAGQLQSADDAFTIPASGYAQLVWTGGAAAFTPILHVDFWKTAHDAILYQDSAGAIGYDSDGTRVRLFNRNAAGSGAYPDASVLLLGRGYQWRTWSEFPAIRGDVTLLTDANVRAIANRAYPDAGGSCGPRRQRGAVGSVQAGLRHG